MKTFRKILFNGKVKKLFGEDFCYKDDNENLIELKKYKCLPPVEPKVIVCVHLNYKSRLEELNRKKIVYIKNCLELIAIGCIQNDFFMVTNYSLFFL